MSHISPHINFNGNAEEAMTFYKTIFGTEFKKIIRFRDLSETDFTVEDDEVDKILHIELPIGESILIANDVPKRMGRVSENENRSKIAITADSKEEADTIFAGLSKDGEVEMPLDTSPWGTYFAMLRDQYGIEWTIEYDADTANSLTT